MSTFGKDSESSERKDKNLIYCIKNKKPSMLGEVYETKSRYEQILSQRRTEVLREKNVNNYLNINLKTLSNFQ